MSLRRPPVSPHDQNVTFVELFFDLVFVFSVTQVVAFLHHHLDPTGAGQSILVFWLIWWAWTQFTWALNAADTNDGIVRLGTLVATGIAFLMAVTVPDAFHGKALWFAIPYVAVRTLGLVLYAWVASADPSQRAAVRRFWLASVAGLGAVIVGAVLGGTAQLAWWCGAIALDVVAALIGGRHEGWNLHPDHFCERHSLFVIIALGESLIVAAIGLSGAAWTPEFVKMALLTVALTCGLWWIYFSRAKPNLDRALEGVTGAALAGMARDVYSLFHFPILLGIIAYAVTVEASLAHPHGELDLATRATFGASILLFGGGMVLATWRATGRVLWVRLILSLATLALVLAVPVTAALAFGAGFLATLLVAWMESRGGSGPVAVLRDEAP